MKPLMLMKPPKLFTFLLCLHLIIATDGFSGGFGKPQVKGKAPNSRPPEQQINIPPLSPQAKASLQKNYTGNLEALAFKLYGLSLSLPPTATTLLHAEPLVLTIDNFLSHDECSYLISCSTVENEETIRVKSQTCDKADVAKQARQSTTFYHKKKNAKTLVDKATALLNIAPSSSKFEETQTVRYAANSNDSFTSHIDALNPADSKTYNNGGQRTATLIVYLNDVDDDIQEENGCTVFRDLDVRVEPERGKALLFFPSVKGSVDIRTIHSGEKVRGGTDKWIAQIWVRENDYDETVKFLGS